MPDGKMKAIRCVEMQCLECGAALQWHARSLAQVRESCRAFIYHPDVSCAHRNRYFRVAPDIVELESCEP